MGIAQVFLGLAKAHQRQGVGTSIPVARKGSCETGLSWRMVLVSANTIPRLGRMFMARLHRRALAFLGFWVQRLLSQRGESAPRNRRGWQTESRRSKAVIARDGGRAFAECPRQAMA